MITKEKLESWYTERIFKSEEIKEEYDDGQGRRFDILDEELE